MSKLNKPFPAQVDLIVVLQCSSGDVSKALMYRNDAVQWGSNKVQARWAREFSQWLK